MSHPQIKILSEDLINKIAAGEVVERPASVVKELIENSIDAGATQINIEIQSSGKKLIRVSDNGCGLTEEEIKLALERHSTSKIGSLDDLFNIKTLGFRGEALPSVASVSQLKMEPNPSGSGITVTVKDLFYNTPARKKFLKSDATETGHTGEIISKYTLAYPKIIFKFISDGKPLITSTGSGSTRDAVLAIYGGEITKELIEVNGAFPAGSITGFVSRPNISRLDKNYESFFVNGRFVRNFLLNRALEEAYRTLIPGNRYPIGIIFIEIEPGQVDVNVHPTKREVKFLKTNEVMEALTSAVSKALSNVCGYQEIRASGEMEWKPEMMDAFFPVTSNQLPVTSQEFELKVSAIQLLFPIYQLKNTYIIATDGEELVLIDQHAAHERILYDQLIRQPEVPAQQSLLLPETIECGAAESSTLLDNLDYLRKQGFEIEEFGSNSFIIRAVPAVSSKADLKPLLRDLLSELQEIGESTQLEIKQETLRKLIACHSAIKAGDKLTQAEMNQLINDLYSTENPLTCPHGRPTMFRFTEGELNKRFGR